MSRKVLSLHYKINMNLKLLLFVAMVAAMSASSCARSIAEPDNSLSSPSNPRLERRDWIKINKAPPTQITQTRGVPLELECEVIGSPTPIVQWVHGSGQMVDWDDFESNIISESSPNAITRVHSRLVLDHTSQASERTYTCIGRAGGQTTYATTTVYQQDATKSNFTELLSNGHHLFGGLKKARITLYYVAMFDTIGSTVILPCKTVGRPLPEVYWLDEEANIINGLTEPRFKTLPTGELIITSLRWEDMGAYSCVAKNPISKDVITTFLYPLKPN